MLDSTKRRLERLADDAQELDDSPRSLFGFALLTNSKSTRIRSHQEWVRIGRYAAVHSDDPLVMTAPPYQVELFANDSRCIWWWGNSEGIDRFREWAERLSSIIDDDSNLLGDIEIKPGVFGTLCALCLFAREQPELSDLVRERVVRIPDHLFGRAFHHGDKTKKSKVLVTEVCRRVPPFAKAIASHLLGRLPREPRLKMVPEKNTVLLDGTPYKLTPELFAIVDELHKAHGGVVTIKRMKDKVPKLRLVDRIDRLINRDLARNRPEVRKVIKNLPKRGYRIADEFLT